MRIKKLHLTRYGKFTDFTLDFGEKPAETSDFHIIYGLNEAGKSTTLNAWLDFLFGMGNTNPYNFLHHYNTMNIGAYLEIGNSTFDMQRIKAPKNSLLDTSNKPTNEITLLTNKAGLTRDSYKTMFSLDDDSLEKGSEDILNSKGDLGEILFSATAGLDGMSEKFTKIAKTADDIYRKNAPKTQIQQLKKQLNDLQQERNAIDTAASQYKKLNKEKLDAEEKYHHENQLVIDKKNEIDALNKRIDLRKKLKDYRRIQQEIEKYTDFKMPPNYWRAEMPSLFKNDSQLQQMKKSQNEQIENLKTKLSQNHYAPQLLELKETIQLLADTPKSRFTTAQVDMDKRKDELQQKKIALEIALKQFNQPNKTAHALSIDKNRLNALKILLHKKNIIDEKLENATNELEIVQKALQDFEANHNTIPDRTIDNEKIILLEAKISELHDKGLISQKQIVEATIVNLQNSLNCALAQLHPFYGSFADLNRLIIPNNDYWIETQQNYQRLNDQLNDFNSNNTQLADKIAEIETTIATLNKRGMLVDTQTVQELAKQRMQKWQYHYTHLNLESANQFLFSMQKHDDAINKHLNHFEQIAQIEQAQLDLKEQQNKQKNLIDTIAQKEAEIKKNTNFITQILQKIGIKQDMPTNAAIIFIQEWLIKRQNYITTYEKREHEKSQLQDIQSQLENIQNEIYQNLAPATQNVDIKALLAIAKQHIETQKSLQHQKIETERAFQKAKNEVNQRQLTLDDILKNVMLWQQDWQSSLDGLWLADITNINIIAAYIEKLEPLSELLSQCDNLEHRVTAMQKDLNNFYHQVTSLYEHAKLDNTKITIETTLSAFNDLQNKVIDATQKATTSHNTQNELNQLEQEYQNTRQQLANHNDIIHQRFEYFNNNGFSVTDLNELNKKLDFAKELTDKQQELKKYTHDIKIDYDCDDIEIALKNININDTDTDLNHLNELHSALELLHEQKQQAFALLEEKRKRLDSIDGDDKVAILDGKKQTIKLIIEDLAFEFLKLKSGLIFAQEALAEYRDQHRSSMLERASQAFKNITSGHYNGLATQLEGGTEKLVAISKDGRSKLSSTLSKGTRFQLYLSLRFAAYQEFAQNHEAIPFIADDIMETFDEPRSKQALHLMDIIAKSGQVIYLTHHKHICDLALNSINNVKIHTLP